MKIVGVAAEAELIEVGESKKGRKRLKCERLVVELSDGTKAEIYGPFLYVLSEGKSAVVSVPPAAVKPTKKASKAVPVSDDLRSLIAAEVRAALEGLI